MNTTYVAIQFEGKKTKFHIRLILSVKFYTIKNLFKVKINWQLQRDHQKTCQEWSSFQVAKSCQGTQMPKPQEFFLSDDFVLHKNLIIEFMHNL